MNDKKNQIQIIHPNFMKEMSLKIDDTKKSKSCNPFQFYVIKEIFQK